MCAGSACPADPNIQSILPCVLPIDFKLVAVFFSPSSPIYIDSCSIRHQKRTLYTSPVAESYIEDMESFYFFFFLFFLLN